MDIMIEDQIKALSIVPKYKDWLIEAVKEQYEDELESQNQLLEDAKKYEQKLLTEMDSLLDLRISNEISLEKYTTKKAEREALLIRVARD